MKLTDIPDSLLLTVVALALIVAQAIAPNDTFSQMIIFVLGILGGIARNRMSPGTSLIQTGANASVVTDEKKG